MHATSRLRTSTRPTSPQSPSVSLNRDTERRIDDIQVVFGHFVAMCMLLVPVAPTQ